VPARASERGKLAVLGCALLYGRLGLVSHRLRVLFHQNCVVKELLGKH
jgi:hypothetical protein